MPVLKNPYKLKMANGESTSPGTLILEKESQGTNPFEEDLEENERDFFLGSSSPGHRIPSSGGGSEFGGDLFNGSSEGRYRRRATLEKLVGLSPFRLAKGKKEKSPSGEKGSDRRSFLGRLMIPLAEGNQDHRSPEKRKTRRSSEDFSLLQLLNGRRKESLCSLDCGLAEKENSGGSDTMKRMSFLKIGLGAKVRRASLVEKSSQAEAPEPVAITGEVEPKVKEPLSVLEILNLIQQRDLLTADEHIIELEAECEQDGQQSPEGSEARKDGSRKAKDVALLYEALLKQLWAVLAEALVAKSTSLPLELMVRVIEQEENTDRQWLEAKRGVAGGSRPRPRALKRQWEEAVGRLVSQRLHQCVEGRAGPLATQMDRLAKCTVEDLCTVKFHLLHAYPKEYEAFSVYLRSFHQGLACHLAEVAQRSLTTPELYFILDWCNNIYQREVLGRPEIASLVKAQELGPLLPPETQLCLEEACIAAVQEKIVSDMNQELQREEERWAQETKDDCSQSSLSSRVISVLKAHADKAPQIAEGFGMRMAHCCLNSLAGFLQSFQKKVDWFHEGQAETSLTADNYMEQTIMLVNCCPPFRAYVERLARFGHPESEAAKRQANSSLDRVTRLCNHVLAEQLFQKLKPYFHKLMKRKWLGNSEAFPTIMALLAEHTEKLSRMELQPYQMLVKDVHRRMLIEYVRPLMRVRFICTSSKMRGKVAQKLRSEAKQLQEFFTRLESASSWLDSVVPHLAGIIELEDTPAIQMEVGFLTTKFPDVQKKHLVALLDVRGLQSQAQRQDILAVLESPELAESEASLCQDRAFFSEIPTGEVFCVRVQLHRISHLGHSCLSRLHWRPGQRQRRRQQRRRPREEHEAEAESQV